MKNLHLVLLLLSMPLFSQNDKLKADDMGRISLAAYVPEQVEHFPIEARSLLLTKLNQIVTKGGMGGRASNERFIITAGVAVLSKDVLPTAPPTTSMTLEVTMYIGDGIEGTKFASTSVTVKGAGETEIKAYMTAIKNISPGNQNVQSFVEQGKTRIIEYYNSKCDFILKEAESLASQNKFDESIFKLVTVPEVCKACFDKAMDAVADIYKRKIDRECKQMLAEATAAWNSSQDGYAADIAGPILAQIEPSASCYKEAQALSAKIEKRIKELDQREWKFAMKVQQDETNIRLATIKAARDIGVAYGNGQPKNITYNVRGWYPW